VAERTQSRRTDSERDEYGDLSVLDLDNIDIEDDEQGGGRGRHYLFVAFLLGLGALTLWLPTTEWFMVRGQGGWFFLLCGVGIVDGVLLGRMVLAWAEAAGARHAARQAEAPEPKPDKPPSALRRWLTLLVALGGGAAVIFGVPASAYYASGDAYHSTWFLGAGGALVVGILLARWLLMQANAAPLQEAPREPIKLPPWFKWVTLGVLVSGGVAAFIANVFYANPDSSGSFEFGISAVGFAVGLSGAIWLARRFDELEKQAAARKE